MDKYQVEEMIGEGSFGRVFKATSRATGDPVALKLIPKVYKSVYVRLGTFTYEECSLLKST
jgi:serine/threonine protein kinase